MIFNGIRTADVLAAAVTKTADVAFQTVLSVAIAAGTVAAPIKKKFRIWIPITVGAAGGVKLQITGPVGIGAIKGTLLLVNTVAPAITAATIAALSTPFANALANAGDHWIEADLYLENTGVAGTIAVQMACNSAAGALVIAKGSILDILSLN